MKLNPQAEELNRTIQGESAATFALLSEKGKRMFFPKFGIVGQSLQAKKLASPSSNATIGIASDQRGPLGYESMKKYFARLNNDEVFNYTSSMGNAALREAWKKRIGELNPLLKNKSFSLPVVCAGLTHAMHTVSELFLNPGDTVILPDQIWGNYRLMLNVKNEINIAAYPFFNKTGLNIEGLKRSLQAIGAQNRAAVILNFPNNPTGYSPTKTEAAQLAKMLTEMAEHRQLLVVLDEAYYGLFFDNEVYAHSLFSLLADAHENLGVVKVCGATKEFFAWGFRVGFISYAIKGGNASLYAAIEAKLGGLVRASISNCSTSAQNILLKVIESGSYKKDFAANYQCLKERIEEVKTTLASGEYDHLFTALPFNSGYFMLIRLKQNLPAEEIRVALLKEEQAGVICTSQHELRVAFSCLEKEVIQSFFKKIANVCNKFV